jgi:hypothetical protein
MDTSLLITPLLNVLTGTLDKRLKDHLRCVVLVLLDELTGNMVVHVGTVLSQHQRHHHHHVCIIISSSL